jgi:hypothetical protein
MGSEIKNPLPSENYNWYVAWLLSNIRIEEDGTYTQENIAHGTGLKPVQCGTTTYDMKEIKIPITIHLFNCRLYYTI